MQTRSKTLSLFSFSRRPEAVQLSFATNENVKRYSAAPAAPVKRARRQLIEDLRYACDDSDNDSTSTYHTEDDEDDDDEPISPRELCNVFEHNKTRTTENRAKESQQRATEDRIEYSVNIDFDEASRTWRSNKVLVGEGHFAYKCDSCDRRSVKDSIYCGVHRREAAKKNKTTYQSGITR